MIARTLFTALSGLLLVWPLVEAGAAPSQAQMDQRCEQAREAKLAPLRQEKIDECKAEGKRKPAECERYYQDYGHGRRSAGGAYTPRMFDNLPECVEAREMRNRVREGRAPVTSREEGRRPVQRDSVTNTRQREGSKTVKSRESGRDSSTRDSTSRESSR